MRPFLDFEWDERKAERNVTAHGLSFETAIGVFADPNLIEIDTTRDEDNEIRSKAIGMIEDKLFTVVFTRRDHAIRLISARRSNKNEERAYG